MKHQRVSRRIGNRAAIQAPLRQQFFEEFQPSAGENATQKGLVSSHFYPTFIPHGIFGVRGVEVGLGELTRCYSIVRQVGGEMKLVHVQKNLFTLFVSGREAK